MEQAAAPAAAPEQGGGVEEVMMKTGQMLDSLAQGIAGTGAPPEAIDKITQASALFQEAMSILQGGGQPTGAVSEHQQAPR